jgi:beta-lactamase class A
MKCLSITLALMITVSWFPDTAARDTDPLSPIPGIAHSSTLQKTLDQAVERALQHFAIQQLRRDQVAVTIVDLAHRDGPTSASHRGDVPIYPASVIKLFYLVAVHQWLEDGRLQDTTELRRAMHDMIVHSYNEPTHYIVDLLTETTSGPELPEAELELWHDRRNAVNRYFTGLGYRGINVNQKPWCEGPYGRESQAIQRFEPNRNWLTTDATARLLAGVFLDQTSSPKRCAEIRELLHRDLNLSAHDPDAQARFTGPALPSGSRLWSKAGWTSQTRHDAACVELPNGRRIILVIFTVDHSAERRIIPTIASNILEHLP